MSLCIFLFFFPLSACKTNCNPVPVYLITLLNSNSIENAHKEINSFEFFKIQLSNYAVILERKVCRSKPANTTSYRKNGEPYSGTDFHNTL